MKNASILIVDDEVEILDALKQLLESEGYSNVITESRSVKVPNIIEQKKIDLILLDISMPEMDGLSLLEIITQTDPNIPVIVVTAVDLYKFAFNAIKLGAYDYFVKPIDVDKLLVTIRRALERRVFLLERDPLRAISERPVKRDLYDDIIAKSPAMSKVFNLIEIFSPTVETILIIGETGTGKDLVSRKIHQLSPRKEKPFVEVNLASITPSLFESELFGYMKGAFTGASNDRIGFFEQANGGTIFLDEIGELPKELQGKLLRVIQYGEIYRVGGSKPIKLDIRIIAATNRDLYDAINAKEFRTDLFYRLTRGFIQLPPLRERGEDIILLAEHFLNVGNNLYKKYLKGFSPEVIEALQNYSFPGNVRELENMILNSVAQSKNQTRISNIDLLDGGKSLASNSTVAEFQTYTIEEVVNSHILNVLNSVEGKVQKAASLLGISERTLQRKLANINKLK